MKHITDEEREQRLIGMAALLGRTIMLTSMHHDIDMSKTFFPAKQVTVEVKETVQV